jgi:hypothetical protein
MTRIVWCFALLVGCASDHDWCDLTGDWQGTWTSQAGGAGVMATTFAVHSGDVTGTVSFSGSPCFATADLAMVAANGQITGSATADAVEVDLSAHWVEDHLEGTFDVISAGACTGDTGTFTLQRH